MKLLLFGITRDITGKDTISVPANAGINTVEALKKWMGEQYPAMQKLKSIAVAINGEYADDENILEEGSEIALIPPVSGG